HQTFVPTREGTVRDVLFDTTGVFLSFWFVKKYFTRLQKYL
ncbi:MAG: VanZ family protein, partial [Candidatus Paceibacterota bacterium]